MLYWSHILTKKLYISFAFYYILSLALSYLKKKGQRTTTHFQNIMFVWGGKRTKWSNTDHGKLIISSTDKEVESKHTGVMCNLHIFYQIVNVMNISFFMTIPNLINKVWSLNNNQRNFNTFQVKMTGEKNGWECPNVHFKVFHP